MAPRKLALHILYGIPCAGKSTSAVHLASLRDIRTVIHTDYIREVQRYFAPPEEAALLSKVTHNAWELYGPATRQTIVTGFLNHVEAVAVGIGVVVRKLVSDGFDAVIEGAHFHSGIVEDLRMANRHANIQATLLVVGDAEELQKRVSAKESARADGAEQKRWRENLPTMLTIQDYLISDARGHGIRIATNDDEWSAVYGPGGNNPARLRSRAHE